MVLQLLAEQNPHHIDCVAQSIVFGVDGVMDRTVCGSEAVLAERYRCYQLVKQLSKLWFSQDKVHPVSGGVRATDNQRHKCHCLIENELPQLVISHTSARFPQPFGTVLR